MRRELLKDECKFASFRGTRSEFRKFLHDMKVYISIIQIKEE